MDMLMQLQEQYRAYDEKAAQVRKEAKGFAGMWGMGDDPRRHHCHDVFYEDVGAWVAEFLNTRPNSALVVAAARWILGAAAERREEESFWYTFAAQSHVVPMIPWMRPEECKALADWYDTLYTKIERLPAQRDLYKKLRKAAKDK